MTNVNFIYSDMAVSSTDVQHCERGAEGPSSSPGRFVGAEAENEVLTTMLSWHGMAWHGEACVPQRQHSLNEAPTIQSSVTQTAIFKRGNSSGTNKHSKTTLQVSPPSRAFLAMH